MKVTFSGNVYLLAKRFSKSWAKKQGVSRREASSSLTLKGDEEIINLVVKQSTNLCKREKIEINVEPETTTSETTEA